MLREVEPALGPENVDGKAPEKTDAVYPLKFCEAEEEHKSPSIATGKHEIDLLLH